MCSAKPTASDWREVYLGEYFDHDMERVPLQIQTDSDVGSGDVVLVEFKTANLRVAGGIWLKFTDPPGNLFLFLNFSLIEHFYEF